jgi:hypothetical protein
LIVDELYRIAAAIEASAVNPLFPSSFTLFGHLCQSPLLLQAQASRKLASVDNQLFLLLCPPQTDCILNMAAQLSSQSRDNGYLHTHTPRGSADSNAIQSVSTFEFSTSPPKMFLVVQEL